MNTAHNTNSSIATSRTSGPRADKRWSPIWGAPLAALIMAAVVVGSAVAGPAGPGAQGSGGSDSKSNKLTFDSTKSCQQIASEAADKVKKQTGSDSKAKQTYSNVKNACLDSRR